MTHWIGYVFWGLAAVGLALTFFVHPMFCLVALGFACAAMPFERDYPSGF